MTRKTCALTLTTIVLAIMGLNSVSSNVDDGDCSALKPQTVGPDVIVGIIGQDDGSDITNWGTVGDITAFSFATTSCNRGNQPLNWNCHHSRSPGHFPESLSLDDRDD